MASVGNREFEREVLSKLTALEVEQSSTKETLSRMEQYFERIFSKLDSVVTKEDCKNNRAACSRNLELINSMKAAGKQNQQILDSLKNPIVYKTAKTVYWALGFLGAMVVALAGVMFKEIYSVREFVMKLLSGGTHP